MVGVECGVECLVFLRKSFNGCACVSSVSFLVLCLIAQLMGFLSRAAGPTIHPFPPSIFFSLTAFRGDTRRYGRDDTRPHPTHTPLHASIRFCYRGCFSRGGKKDTGRKKKHPTTTPLHTTSLCLGGMKNAFSLPFFSFPHGSGTCMPLSHHGLPRPHHRTKTSKQALHAGRVVHAPDGLAQQVGHA